MRDAAAGLLGWLSFLSIFVLPHHAVAQVNKPHQIGFLTPASAASMADRLARLRKGLRDLGYVEGQNTTLEIRSAEGEQQRLGALADELIRLKVDVILTHGAAATLAAKKASTTTRIVCFACGELVSTGLVSSLALGRALEFHKPRIEAGVEGNRDSGSGSRIKVDIRECSDSKRL